MVNVLSRQERGSQDPVFVFCAQGQEKQQTEYLNPAVCIPSQCDVSKYSTKFKASSQKTEMIIFFHFLFNKKKLTSHQRKRHFIRQQTPLVRKKQIPLKPNTRIIHRVILWCTSQQELSIFNKEECNCLCEWVKFAVIAQAGMFDYTIQLLFGTHFQVQKRKNRQLTLGGLRFAKSLLRKELRSCKAIKHVIYNCRHL